MQSVNNKIIVTCDVCQKDTIKIGENVFKSANIYEKNYRYRSPVISTVVEGNELLNTGDAILCHHNLYYLPSPYHLEGSLFSVPFGNVLFAKIFQDGTLFPICGNILGTRIVKNTNLPLLPDSKMDTYDDRMIVSNSGYTQYKNGETVYARPSSCYDIIYNWNGEEKMVTKINSEMVCGRLK